MEIFVSLRVHGEAFIPEGNKALLEKLVGGCDRRDASNSQFLEQPILQSIEQTLDSALCLWRQSGDQPDIE
jgi:hypothetical protein